MDKLNPFRSNHRLVARGLNKGSALMAVMRKMLAVAAHLLKYPEAYEPTHGLLPKNTAQQGAVQGGNGVPLAIFAIRDISSQGLTNLMASLPTFW